MPPRRLPQILTADNAPNRKDTMPEFVECTTQEQFDAVVKDGNWPLVRAGYFRAYDSASVRASDSASVSASDSASVSASDSASVSAYDSASVRAYDSASVRAYDSASVRAYGSASVRASGSASVSAYDSASVRAYDSASVSAYDSASVRASDSASVSAYDSASVRAYGSASVRAYDSASVRASPFVAVQKHGTGPRVNGGVLIQISEIQTTEEFCEFYGIKPVRGAVTLFKLVDDNYVSSHGTSYKPSENPVAEDWSERDCCGHGLHFSPRPFLANRYASGSRYVACRVKLSDIVVITGSGTADKCKARTCAVLYECDEDGVKLAT